MIDSKTLKENLTPEQITRIVCALGSSEPQSEGNESLRFQTVCHHGDSFKLYYFLDSKMFHCFTHCKQNFDIYELVERSKGVGFSEALHWICDICGIDENAYQAVDQGELDSAEDWDFINRMMAYSKSNEQTPPVLEPLDPHVLDYFGPPCAPQEWIDDGISPQVMAAYGIRVDIGTKRIIIPHYDIDGRLVGIRCRNFDEEVINNFGKYMPATREGDMYNHRLGLNLYGLWQNKCAIAALHKVMIVEAEKSVMQAATMFGMDKNFTVATCGHQISPSQADLLINMDVNEIILAYDHDVLLHKDALGNKDEATKKFEEEMLDVVRPFVNYFYTEIIFDYDNTLGLKDSPTDDGKEKLIVLMKRKVRGLARGLQRIQFEEIMKEKTMAMKKKAENAIPRFSFSKLECWQQCGFRYFLNYVDNHYISEDTAPLEFGTLVHHIYERIGVSIINGGHPNYEEMKKEFKSINIPKKDPYDVKGGIYGYDIIAQKFPEDYFSIDNKDGLSYDGKAQMFLGDPVARTGMYSLEKFLNDNPSYRLQAVEQYFSFDYHGVTLSGYIDRIIYDTKTNDYLIEDIKTKGHTYSSKELADAQQQFVVYAMAVKDIFKMDHYPTKFCYDLPFVGLRQPVGGNPDFIKNGLAVIDAQLEGISKKEFVPHPSPLCHWCPFCGTNKNQPAEAKGLCPYYSLWTPGGPMKVYSVLNKWDGMDNHPIVMEHYLRDQLGEPQLEKTDFDY